MRIVYEPKDGDRREWVYDPNDILSIEAEAIERVTGWTYDEFGEHFMKGSTMAKHALLWVMLRRENKALKYNQVSFRLSELTVELDAAEIDSLEEAVEANDDLDPAERENYLKIIADAREALENANPKASAKTKTSATKN